MNRPLLVPYPKKISFTNGFFTFDFKDCLLIPNSMKNELYETAKRLKEVLQNTLHLTLPVMVDKNGMYRAAVVFEKSDLPGKETYRLKICENEIRVIFQHAAGAFHAVSTLKQLIMQYGRNLPCLVIDDEPVFPVRGIMLDISRDKILKMETLFKLVDFMADLKINQLQLMIEGFSFAYATYPFVWQDGTPMTGEEFIELDRYCRQRYIDLVPNQNSFGHMEAWLDRREFKDLAVSPDGCYAPWAPNVKRKPFTINPMDPKSVEFIDNITSDLVPYFSSSLFNAGCDETFDLDQGKLKELCERIGTGRVYLDFLVKIHDILKKHGKRMMFWGDIIVNYPELIPELPKDIIALEWGYEADHPFSTDGEKFMKSGIEFYVCPGTSSWCSIAGRTDNMLRNLLNAAENGKKFNARGYLNTDWGDNGHWQYQLFSFPGFVYGAALSWGVEQNKNIDICGYLDKFVFIDKNGKFGKLVMDLGNYYLKEVKRVPNKTILFATLLASFENTDVTEGFTEEIYKDIKQYVIGIENELNSIQLQCEDAALLEAEFRNASRLVKHACDLGILKLKMKSGAGDAAIKQLLPQMIDDMNIIIRQHENLWLSRNRHGGLNDSVRHFKELKTAYERLLDKII